MKYDLVVYGGTPSGVSAAVAAARRGLRVVLLAAGSTVGGMMSNGLSASDIGARGPIRGVAKEVFDTIDEYYGGNSAWRVEPHVAEQVFRRLLGSADVEIHSGSELTAVERNLSEVVAVRCGLAEYRGRSFVDASYSGDLFAAVGCNFRLGMGDLLEYGEPLATKRSMTKILDLDVAEDVVRANPFVKVQQRRDVRDGMPSLTFRLCLAPEEAAVEVVPGMHYKEQSEYFRALISAYLARDQERAERLDRMSNGTLHSAYYQLAVIPGGKFDLNAGRASFTNVYTRGAYFSDLESRRAYDASVAELVRNFFHFIQTASVVPAHVRAGVQGLGLAADEFVDNGNWPYEPYLREGRRVVGRHTLTERDIFESRVKVGGVAVGSYPVDSKLTQLIFWDRSLYRDMGPHVKTPLYEIPYWCMVPKGPVRNLLVSVGISASPVAFGSVRLEPQFLALGEAAGVATSLALRQGSSVYELSPKHVQEALLESGSFKKVSP